MTGNQVPRIKIEPPSVGSDGKGASLLMKEYGVTLDEWQELVLSSWLSTTETGAYAVVSGGLSTPRQNGKSEILIARCFYELTVNGGKVLFTSHQMRSVKKIFFRLESMFTDKRHPDINKAVKKIRYGIGEEGIFLTNGGSIEFMARSRQAARGFDGISLIIIDEAQEASNEAVAALLAVLSASKTGTRQVIYAGTPPYVGCVAEVFKKFRLSCITEAERGEVSRNSWHEWSIDTENPAEVDISDKKLWYQANPSLGIRLTEEFTLTEAQTLSTLDFLHERLGFWDKPAAQQIEHAIDINLWDSCKSNTPRPEGKTAFGIKFTADGSEVCLAGAVIPSDGQPARITLIAIEPTGNGLQWLANWLNERYKTTCCVVIDGRNGSADILIDKISGVWLFKGSVIKPSASNVVMAAGMMINELQEKTVSWFSEQEELRESAITSTKRPISGGFGFGGSTSAPIEAAALALWGARTSKRNPGKRMLIG